MLTQNLQGPCLQFILQDYRGPVRNSADDRMHNNEMGPTRDKNRPYGVGGLIGIKHQRYQAQRECGGTNSTGRLLRTVKVCKYSMCFGSKDVTVENNN